MEQAKGYDSMEVEAVVRGRRKQFQNNRMHTVVISLMMFLATGLFWYITPRPVNTKERHAVEYNDQTSPPNKPFSWSEVCYTVNVLLGSRA